MDDDLDKLTEPELKELLKLRMGELPQVVRNAIESADIEKHLRELADTNKLHLDQWQILENEVILTLLDLQLPEQLAENLHSELGVSEELAAKLAGDISRIVFEPIRTELKKQLDALGGEQGNEEEQLIRSHMLSRTPQPIAVSQVRETIVAATPPAPRPELRVARAPTSSSYASGEQSVGRKIVEGDPYREQVD